MSRWRPGVGLRLALAALLLAVILWWVDAGAVLQRLAGADALGLAAALGLSVAANLASALRWHALVRWLGGNVSRRWAAGTYFQAVAINALLPGAVFGGDLYRAHAAHRAGLPLAEAGMSVLVDRVGGLWLLVVVGLLAWAWGMAGGGALAVSLAAAWPWAAASAATAAAIAVAMVALPGLALRFGGMAAGGEIVADEPWPARLRRLAGHPGVLAQFCAQVLWSAAVQALSIGALAVGGAALGLVLPWWAYAVAAVPTFLMAALPVGIGGWGTREAAAAVAFAAFGVVPATAVAVGLVYGACATVQAAVAAAFWPFAGRAVPAQPR